MKGLVSGPLGTPSLADHYYPDLGSGGLAFSQSCQGLTPPPPLSWSKIPNGPSPMHPSFLSPVCPLLELGESSQESPGHTIPPRALETGQAPQLGSLSKSARSTEAYTPHGFQKGLGLGPVFMF